MIPDKPHEFAPASQEGLMFEALKKLPDEYYVFHSYRITTVVDDTFYESETDFIIFNKTYGVICLEAKSGLVKYENGYWYYANGTPMHNGGPFNQASANKYKLIRYIEKSKLAPLINRCKFLHAVWFPSVTDANLRNMTLPSEGDRVLVLTKEALENPLSYVESIYNIQLPNKVLTELSEYDVKRLIREIFCPAFNVFPTASFENDLKKIVFHRMLKEQTAILNFLAEQKTAVINGVAGTGKTMIATEKALRHASRNEKVLFLCYNNQLKNYLSENYGHEMIDYYTISGLACKLCDTAVADYSLFKSKLEDIFLSGKFQYQHVIVDEGQDFGVDEIEESDILQLLKEIIECKDDTGDSISTFYIFYDKLQLVQASQMPQFIEDADCKLTLYRNCRNTENIATTSLRPVTIRNPLLIDSCVKGTPAKLYFCDNVDSAIDKIDATLNELTSTGYRDIVVLTCKTEGTSILANKIEGGLYRNKFRFTTCRKFKGLEADAVILIDVDRDTFNSHNVLIYYVGTSRARLDLEIITMLDDDDCVDILRNIFMKEDRIKKPRRDLASALNSIGKIN